MNDPLPTFASVREMLKAWKPREPVYCVYPHVYRKTARQFLAGFPGRVLYAVKANDEPAVLRSLYRAGVREFDCASIPEIRLVRAICPGARCYFMIPATIRGATREAFEELDVRHFMIDHDSGLEQLSANVDLAQCVVFARMAVSHHSAKMDLSAKFGAPPAEVPGLLRKIRSVGGEAALAFNVGSMVTSPDAYRHAMDVAVGVLESLDFPVRLVDIGGGFPRSYPGFVTPALEEYFRAIGEMSRRLPLAAGGEILAEPGRALAAPGMSAVVEVLLRKNGRLYLNDGMYGAFWELRFKAHVRYPVRAYRDGEALTGSETSFELYGPTCDGSDVLPGAVMLPDGIRPGDHLEFGRIGAYSVSGRTRFNGHFSDRIVEISSESEAPPQN